MLENAKDIEFNDVYDFYIEKYKKEGVNYEPIIREAINDYGERTLELLEKAKLQRNFTGLVNVRMRFLNLSEVTHDEKWSEYFDHCSKLMMEIKNT